MGITAAQTATIGSRVANRVLDTKGAKRATIPDITNTINNLMTNDALIYSLAFSVSFFAKCSETKLTEPEEIPISDKEDRIITKFKAAEKIPNSDTETARATISVKRNPKKAERTFPINNINVSFAVDEKRRPLSKS